MPQCLGAAPGKGFIEIIYVPVAQVELLQDVNAYLIAELSCGICPFQETSGLSEKAVPAAAEVFIRAKGRDAEPFLHLDLRSGAVRAFIYLEDIMEILSLPAAPEGIQPADPGAERMDRASVIRAKVRAHLPFLPIRIWCSIDT